MSFSAWKRDTKHSCKDSSELRKKLCADGSIQYRLQCTLCGQVGRSIRHDTIKQKYDISSIPDIDDDESIYPFSFQNYVHSDISENIPDPFEYYEYLKSEKWYEKRIKVLQRDKFICQGCGDRVKGNANIHHLTYDNRGDELLFQLVTLCRNCHKRVHKIES